jgi:hypothetical protein
MPRLSSPVFTEWHSGHSDCNRLTLNASDPIARQGQTWSTTDAARTCPLSLQPAHNGKRESCAVRIVCHALVLYWCRSSLEGACLRAGAWSAHMDEPGTLDRVQRRAAHRGRGMVGIRVNPYSAALLDLLQSPHRHHLEIITCLRSTPSSQSI